LQCYYGANMNFHICLIQVPNRNRLDNQFYNVLLENNEVDNNFRLELQNNDNRPEFPNQFLWRRGNNNNDQVRCAGRFTFVDSAIKNNSSLTFIPSSICLFFSFIIYFQFMLNVDMSLAFNLAGNITPGSGEVSCSVNTCPQSRLMDITREYAQSNNVWLNDFRAAFTKMTSVGCDSCTAL